MKYSNVSTIQLTSVSHSLFPSYLFVLLLLSFPIRMCCLAQCMCFNETKSSFTKNVKRTDGSKATTNNYWMDSHLLHRGLLCSCWILVQQAFGLVFMKEFTIVNFTNRSVSEYFQFFSLHIFLPLLLYGLLLLQHNNSNAKVSQYWSNGAATFQSEHTFTDDENAINRRANKQQKVVEETHANKRWTTWVCITYLNLYLPIVLPCHWNCHAIRVFCSISRPSACLYRLIWIIHKKANVKSIAIGWWRMKMALF